MLRGTDAIKPWNTELWRITSEVGNPNCIGQTEADMFAPAATTARRLLDRSEPDEALVLELLEALPPSAVIEWYMKCVRAERARLREWHLREYATRDKALARLIESTYVRQQSRS